MQVFNYRKSIKERTHSRIQMNIGNRLGNPIIDELYLKLIG